MSIIRWYPFGEAGTLRRSMDRLIDEFFTQQPGAAREMAQLGWQPAVEMFETDSDVVVKAAVPNVDPKNIDVTVTGDTITLKGETKQEEERKDRNYYHQEMRYGAFARTLPLATEVKSAEAKATYKDGVLEVRIPKADRVKPASVKVQVG